MKYFIYEEDWGVHWYTEEAEFKKAVDEFDFLGKFCDDGWSESVENCFAGVVPEDFVIDEDDDEHDMLEPHATFIVEEFDRRDRPSPDQLNEEDKDGEGTYWGDWGYICHYRFVNKPAVTT